MGLTCLSAVISGCNRANTPTGTTSFSGTRYTTYQNGSEKLVVNADGSYKQFIQAKDHRSIVNTGRWSNGQAPKNSNFTGPWLVMQDYIAPWEWLAAKPKSTVARSPLLISTDGFNGVYAPLAPIVPTSRHRQLNGQAQLLAIILGGIFTILWVLAIVSAAQQRQYVWLVLMVLFPCCVTPVYGLFAFFFAQAIRKS